MNYNITLKLKKFLTHIALGLEEETIPSHWRLLDGDEGFLSG